MTTSYNYIPLTNIDRQVYQDDGHAISSPLLFDLLNELSSDEHHEILELLPANKEFIDTFSNFSCKLYLPGCMKELHSMTSVKYDTEIKLQRALTRRVGFNKKRNESLNMIFLWDLPNYLDKNIMKGLIGYLSQHMHEKVKLHFYIHTKQQMPSMPGIYSFMPEGKVWLEKNNETTTKSPLYFKEALQTLLCPFKVKRSMLLSGGLQEYILEL